MLAHSKARREKRCAKDRRKCGAFYIDLDQGGDRLLASIIEPRGDQ
jgi:hypothetical protein